MTAYVRVCKREQLVEAIDLTGTQVDVAAAAGLSVQRVNQIYTGANDVIEVRKARALEAAVGVPLGSLFQAVDGPLLVPYVHEDDDPDPAAIPAQSATEPATEPIREVLAREAEEIEAAEFGAAVHQVLPAA